jgi:murein DD-endopeptidase MepM/ murein hydrolase activator NlpD
MPLTRTQTSPDPLNVQGIDFRPVIALPEEYEVYDFSHGYDPNRTLTHAYGVGKYDEFRPGMYEGEQFEGIRNIHVGIDIGTPAAEPVMAFFSGSIFKLGENDLPYDYGPTIITRHRWLDQVVYALHGHLSRSSLKRWSAGDTFAAGDVLAHVGETHENGGWNPHLHFQLSLIEPDTHDLPGAVSAVDREWARRAFPDPQLVLGTLY